MKTILLVASLSVFATVANAQNMRFVGINTYKPQTTGGDTISDSVTVTLTITQPGAQNGFIQKKYYVPTYTDATPVIIKSVAQIGLDPNGGSVVFDWSKSSYYYYDNVYTFIWYSLYASSIPKSVPVGQFSCGSTLTWVCNPW